MANDVTNTGTRYPLQLSGADTNDANENILFYVAGSDAIIMRVRANGGTSVIQDTSTVTLVEDQFSKVAVSLKPGEQYFAQDGTLQHSGTNGSTLPAINAMRLGGWVHGNYRLNGHVKKVVIYNTALTSSEITALTEND